MSVQIRVRDFFPSGMVVAAGATAGTEHFLRVVQAVKAASPKSDTECLIFLDFAEIDDATPSYVKATVLALHQCGRRFARTISISEQDELAGLLEPLNVVVGVTGTSEAVQDCIYEVFARRNLAILSGSNVASDRFEGATVLGELEPKIFDTLSSACAFEEFQASDLLLNNPESIGVTGWNNRLAELHRQRLLLRRTDGRANRYRTITKKVYQYGHFLPSK